MKIPDLKKWHKIFIGIVIFIVLLLFAAPRIGKWYTVKHSKELVGRKLEIKKIRINYFTGTVRVYGIKLYESDSKTVFLSFNQLRVNLDYFPLFRNEIYVKSISLDDPFVEVLQNGSQFNFSSLTTNDTSTVKKDTIPSKPTKYIINDIKINRGYVKYTDLSLNHTIALDKLDLLIPGFTWNSDSTNLDVNFRFVDGGGLSTNLDINQADSTYALHLKLDSLNLGIIEPYVKNNLHISSFRGYLSNDIDLKGNMRSVMQLFIKGINHIYDFSMTDTLNRTILSFKELSAGIDSLDLARNIIRLNSVSFINPRLLFEMIDSINNWVALIKPSQSDTLNRQTDTAAVSSSGSYSFSKLSIKEGEILFSDKTLHYPFEYSLDNINLESTPVAGSPDKVDLNITANLNKTGILSMKAVLNPANFSDMDLALTIGQFRMKDLDAYFKHYFGFPVTAGIMNFKTENKIRPNSLISDNSIYFRNFSLSKQLGGKVEYHIPLRLALGILSDKDGIIDLKAPVETKGEEVKVKNLGRIILKVIGNLFIKAAVSPFNLLSASYKVDPASLQEIRLELMKTSPNEKNLKSVDIIADILSKKPGLDIDFYYCDDREKIIDSLAYLMTLDDYITNNKISGMNSSSVPDSSLIKYIRNQLSSDTTMNHKALKELCRSFIGTKKVEARLDSIKASQINFLTNYLTVDKEILPERFRVINIAPDTIKPSEIYPAFRNYFRPAGEK